MVVVTVKSKEYVKKAILIMNKYDPGENFLNNKKDFKRESYPL